MAAADFSRERDFQVDCDAIGLALAFLETALEEGGCDLKIASRLKIAFDEIVSNIVKFSKASDFRLRIAEHGGMWELEFSDSGVEWNPLVHKDPDTTLPLEEREVGGLGIFMVKRLMDSVEYRREDGRNILSMRKR